MHAVLKITIIAVAMVAIGLLSVWTQQSLLAPSLASAVFLQAFSPSQPTSGPYSVGVGQIAGLVGGLIGVYVATSATLPAFMVGHPLVYLRVLAVLIAVVVTAALQIGLKATSPAGGATALVLALGTEAPDWGGAVRMLIAIVLVTAIGEVGRQLLLRRERTS